jgi:PAS domain S-box-containing protein
MSIRGRLTLAERLRLIEDPDAFLARRKCGCSGAHWTPPVRPEKKSWSLACAASSEGIGLHFPPTRIGELQRALLPAATELGLRDAEALVEELLAGRLDDARMEVVARHLAVGETYFMRGDETFFAPGAEVIPALIAAPRNAGRGPVTLWSAGRHTGEEAYSLATRIKETLINVAPLRDADGNPAGATDSTLDVGELVQAQQHLAASRQLAQATLDALPSRICVLDEQGLILTVNQAWRKVDDGSPAGAVAREGDNYVEVCEQSPIADADIESARFVAGLRGVTEGRLHDFTMEYSRGGPDQRRWFFVRVSCFEIDGMVRFVVSHHDVTDRRQAEERERESAVLLDIAGEMARIGGWAYDVAGERMSWSKEVAAIHEVQEAALIDGANAEYAPGFDQAMVFYRENCPRIADCLDACVHQGEPFDEEAQMTTAAGGRRWVRAIGVAIRNEAGSIVRVQGAFQDISAIKASEERVAGIAERLTTTLESITDAFYTLDRVWAFTYVNREAARIMQKTSIELVGENIWDVFPEAVGTEIERQFAKAVAEQVAVQFETYYAPLDLWADVHAYPSDEGLAVYFRDVTQRKHAEMALRNSEESLRLAISASGLGTWGWDKDSRQIRVSDQTKAMFGTPPEAEMTFDTFMDSVHPDDRVEVMRLLQLSMETSSDFRADFRIVQPDGSVRWIASLGRAQADETRAALRMEGVNLDITERKRSERELRELNERLEQRVEERTEELAAAKQQAEAANEAKSAFLAMMSHEIRTPMNGVIGMVDVISHGELSAHQRDAMRTVRKSAFALLALIDDILDFSKIEAGRLDLERKEVSLSELVEGVCDTLGPVAGRKGVDLFVFVSPQGPEWVWADPVRLRQILFNLVGNAIKFSGDRGDKRGRIDIRVEPVSGPPLAVQFRVSDNGIGISPEAGTHLFESFRQAEVSTTRRYGGTGLGLAICKRLTELMGGTISFDSVVGEGTTFKVQVPLEAAPEIGSTPVPDLGGLDFIVAPGSNFQAEDLREYLGSAGARVRVVADLDEAAEASKHMDSPVVVHAGIDGDDHQSGDALAVFAEERKVRHLVILQGRRRAARVPEYGVVEIVGNCMRRKALLHAAAVAAGRASPDQENRLVPAEMDHGDAMVAPTVSEARRQGRLILVVEDDATNQKVVLRQLELLGHAAEVAANGTEALRLLKSGSYALVLSDLHMPGLDGYELAHEIRRRESPDQRIPVIALTGNALRGEADRAFAAGFDEYLTKPTQLSLLRAVLHKWLPHERPAGEDVVDGSALETTETGDVAETAPPHAIDIEVLRGLLGEDRGLWIDLLEEYRAGALSDIRDLQAAAAACDWNEVASIAHRLKSPSRTIGAMGLGDLCAEIETDARLADEAAVTRIVVVLEDALESVLASIDGFCEETSE